MKETLSVRDKLNKIWVCDPGCEGRCRVCPQDVVEEAIKYIDSIKESAKGKPELFAWYFKFNNGVETTVFKLEEAENIRKHLDSNEIEIPLYRLIGD